MNLDLATAVLQDLVEYYQLIKNDSTQSGNLRKSLFFESTCGHHVKAERLIYQFCQSVGASKRIIYRSVQSRQSLEDRRCLVPLIDRLARKSPSGHIITMQWRLDAVYLMEQDSSSVIVKGSNAVYRERVKTQSGDVVMLRQKRCLVLSPLQLFEQAVKEIKWPFCLRSLMAVRPAWILMPHKRHLEGCLCAMCQNPVLLLRGLKTAVTTWRRDGARDTAVDLGLPFSPASLISLVLCPIEEGKDMHNYDCYTQKCRNCGRSTFQDLFSPLLAAFGDSNVTFFQHIFQASPKPDGSCSKKWELVKMENFVEEVLEMLENQVFGEKGSKKENFLFHSLKKLLALKARRNLRKNLQPEEAVV